MSNDYDYYESEIEKDGKIVTKGRRYSDTDDWLLIIVWIFTAIIAIVKWKGTYIILAALLLVSIIIGIPLAIYEASLPPAPITLSELNVSNSESCMIFRQGEHSYRRVYDSIGNEYTTSYFDLCSYNDNSIFGQVDAYADIETNGEYMYLSGTVFCRENQNPDFHISFSIYADGVLVYESKEMTRDTHPKHFKICINNAQTVRIKSTSNDYTFMETNPGVILVDTICSVD